MAEPTNGDILNILDTIVANMATKEDIRSIEERMATKSDLQRIEERMVTKEDIVAVNSKIDGIWRFLDSELDKRKVLEVRVAHLEK